MSEGEWKAARSVKTEQAGDAWRLSADGIYPEIATRKLTGLEAGLYAVTLEVRVPTSGRMRFAWKGAADAGVLEFFPRRDGEWHEVTGIFNAQEPITELRLAAPTHLKETGHYDPVTQPDFVEVKKIVLQSLDRSRPLPSKVGP